MNRAQVFDRRRGLDTECGRRPKGLLPTLPEDGGRKWFPQTGSTTCWSQRRQNRESEVHKGPIRKPKRMDNLVDHLERWGCGNTRIEVRPDGALKEWHHWAEPDLIG